MEMSEISDQIVPEQNVIKIGILDGKGYIWNADDVHRLRRDYRIVGCTVGCLPRNSNQNVYLGLPLQLMPEQISLLLEKGIAEISDTSHFNDPPPSEIIEHLEKLQDDLYKQQVAQHREKRKAEVMCNADLIIEGKRKKMLEKALGKPHQKKGKSKKRKTNATEDQSMDSEGNVTLPEIDKEQIMENELDKIQDLPKENCAVQLFTRCPWTPKSSPCSSWTFPSDETESRFHIFKDLWEKNYYLTSGGKFGGDFLAYPGDPLRYHAFYVVVCVPYTKPLQAMDVITMGRLGTQVKKTVLLATLKPDGLVDYISLKWSGD